MADELKEKAQQQELKPRQPASPLIFISHDSRDADIAEAFGVLLRRISAGMLKTFRSSDKKGTEGIEFGDEWYKRLMSALETASDVVCLFTERSIERPWLLYEAGVAKAKLDRPVLGVALGVSLSKVGTGPFYQFQNSDDSEDSLRKLVMQLARRIPALEPDPEVVQAQVHAFKARVDELIADIKGASLMEKETPSETSTANLLEEVKVIVRDLPVRVERLLGDGEIPDRRRHLRWSSFKFIEELRHMLPNGPDDPIMILIATSLFRDEIPWLYELGREAYEAVYARNRARRERALTALRRAMELTIHGPIGIEVLGESSDTHMMFRDSLRFMEHAVERLLHSPEEP